VEFAERLRHAANITKVEITGERQLDVTSTSGGVTAYLDHAYADYLQKPENKLAIMDHYIAPILETADKTAKETPIDVKHIVPVIKNRVWLDTARQLVKNAGARTPGQEPAFDELNDELIIVYAEDQEKKLRFLASDELTKAKVDRLTLREIAVDNLTKLLPSITPVRDGGFYIVAADGMYESSLLLKDSLWRKGTFDVKGDIVVAIPARDKLFVTGSEDAAGLVKMKAGIDLAQSRTSYPLSSEMFVLREGRFTRFVPR